MRELNWKFLDEIEDYEDFGDYAVFENGWVYSFKTNKWLTGKIDPDGYRVYCLHDDFGSPFYPRAHVLVAKAFIPNSDNLPTVDHIDRNKENNLVENLRWASHKTQCENRETSETREKRQVHDKTTGFIYKDCQKAAEAIGGNNLGVWKCCKGLLKSYKGHIFEYVD